MGKKNGVKKGNAPQVVEDDDDFLNQALAEAKAERGNAAEVSKAAEELCDLGLWTEAIAKLSEAIALDPNNGKHFCRRAAARIAAYQGAGRREDALTDAKAAAVLGGATNQESADCHAMLGQLLLAQGQPQAARDAYDKGLKLAPKHAACRQGREEAAVLLEKNSGTKSAPEMGPDDFDAQELHTLPCPEEVLGKGFEVVILKVGMEGKPLKFLVSTTLSMEAAITPNTCGMLGYPIKREVDLQDVMFSGGHLIGDIKGVMVTSFVQAHMAEKALHATLHGVVGLPFLERFDIDIDRLLGEQRFKRPGAMTAQGKKTVQKAFNVQKAPSVELPGGLLGMPVALKSKDGNSAVNVLGIIDTGSMFSVMSWQAAKELGIAHGPEDPVLKGATKVAGATKDGVVKMPLVQVRVHLCEGRGSVTARVGGMSKEEFEATGKGRGWSLGLEHLSSGAAFGMVNVAIGDAIPFEMLKDSSVGDFSGGAIVIGQDVLAQAPRFALSAKDRQVWIDAPSRAVDAAPI